MNRLEIILGNGSKEVLICRYVSISDKGVITYYKLNGDMVVIPSGYKSITIIRKGVSK